MITIYYSEFGSDIRKITDYLNEHGYYPDSAHTVSILWERFSDELYFAGWIRVEEYTLQSFIDYVEKYISNTDIVRRLDR